MVELHVETLTHTFKVARGKRAFYTDKTDLKVVYLDTLKTLDRASRCGKWVTVDVYCRDNGFTPGGFGYVGCADMWCDEHRCRP